MSKKKYTASDIEKDVNSKNPKLIKKVGKKRGRVQYYITKEGKDMDDAFGITTIPFLSYTTADYNIVLNSNKFFSNLNKKCGLTKDMTLAHEIAHYVLRSEGMYDAFDLSEKEEHALICTIERIVTEYEEVKKLYKGVK